MSENPPTRTANSIVKSPLKWAGGKRWLAPLIAGLWQQESATRLVEPFCGGMSVALSLQPERALLNDANVHLINLYSWIKRGLTIEVEARNEEEVYYANRDRFNELIALNLHNTAEAAQLFYYLNRTCFNGLYRFNQKGSFNVPFGSYAYDLNYSPDFEVYRRMFGTWDFTDIDFEEIQLKSDDFIYADPPYDVEFTTYSRGGFSWADQERTARWLSTHTGPVILSNQKTDKILDLYRQHDFEMIFLDAPRRISCNGDRKDVVEVLALRNIRFPRELQLKEFVSKGN